MTRLTLLLMISVLTCCSKAPQEQQDESTEISTTVAFESAHARVSIEGMHCQDCAKAISKAMNGCVDVRSVAVSFERKQAIIIATNSAALACAIHAARAAGYTVGSPQPIEDADYVDSDTSVSTSST